MTEKNTVKNIPVDCHATPGSIYLSIDEILSLVEGICIPLDKKAGTLMDLTVNGKTIACGEIFPSDNKKGFIVKEIITEAFNV